MLKKTAFENSPRIYTRLANTKIKVHSKQLKTFTIVGDISQHYTNILFAAKTDNFEIVEEIPYCS